MGAAWKNPNDRDMPYLEQMVKGVKALGLESCMTLGTLTDSQAQRLAEAGLDYYNHNLGYSRRNFTATSSPPAPHQERLDTLDKVRDAGIKVCSGGIVGLGESVKDRAGLLLQLANLPTPPESVPINMLVKVKGTPLADNDDVDAFDFIRTIAIARIMMPTSYVRLRRPRADERADPGDVLYGRGELDFLRLQAADHAEPGRGQRPAAVPQAGDQPAADGGAGRRQ